MYWCTRQQQRRVSEPSESTPFSSVNNKIDRPNDMKLYPLLNQVDNSSSTKKSRQKNLLQR
jgi:hypothetical protein